MFDAILFDLADTLLHFGKVRPVSLFGQGCRDTHEYLVERRLSPPNYATYRKVSLRAFTGRYIWSNVKGRDFNGLDVIVNVMRKLEIQVTERDLHAMAWMWYRPVLPQAHVVPGTHAMLESFRQMGIRMAIVSNTCAPPHCLDQHLQQEKLLEFFPTRVYSSTTRYRKPHRMIFESALSQLGVDAKRTLFVGDLIARDIRGARRLGMRTVWKPARRKSPINRRRFKPDHTIRIITELEPIVREIFPPMAELNMVG
jgi:HAD superfamily hydrolase (TIGR01662 family)